MRTSGLKRFARAGLIFVGLLATLASAWSCSGKPSTLTIGITSNEVNTLILVAGSQGYFTSNNLIVTIKTYPSGKGALDGLLNHEVDIATGSEYAFAGNVLDGKNVHMMGVISKSIGEYLVARTDKGINSIQHVKGKKIGVPLKSRPEFALGRFLYLQGIDPSEVTLVNVGVDQSANALANGDVDAVATWQPYIDRIMDRLGGQVVNWPVQGGQPSYNGVMSLDTFTADHHDTVVRFLKALHQAETYTVEQPAEARAIVQKKLNYDAAYMASVWPDFQFSLSLDQSLITALEDEARWMIKNKLTGADRVPDFVKYIHVDGLKSVRPEALNIIR